MEGVIAAFGGSYGGWTFYVKNERLHFVVNWMGKEFYEARGETKVEGFDLKVSKREKESESTGRAHSLLFHS